MDFDGELGGYVPGFRDHVFFFGSYNPSWNTVYAQHAQFIAPVDAGTGGLGSAPQVATGESALLTSLRSWSATGLEPVTSWAT